MLPVTPIMYQMMVTTRSTRLASGQNVCKNDTNEWLSKMLATLASSSSVTFNVAMSSSSVSDVLLSSVSIATS